MLQRVGLAILVLSFLLAGRSVRLKPNDPVPVDVLWLLSGDTFRWDSTQEKVLLTFFRYAACPICNYRVHELSKALDSLTNEGFTVIGVFESAPNLLSHYKEEYDIPFSIVADSNGSLHDAFGVRKSFKKTVLFNSSKRIRYYHEKGEELYEGSVYERDGRLFRSTADFVIQNRRITQLDYNAVIGDHILLSDLK